MYIAVFFVDSWHTATGQHFPDFVCNSKICDTREQAISEVYNKAKKIYGSSLKGDPFAKYAELYINNREVTIQVIELER